MKKKIIAIVLALVVVAAITVGLVACNKNNGNNNNGNDDALVIPSDFKIGLITLHDSSSTYDKNFIDAMNSVKDELGLTSRQVMIATGIEEDETCYAKACELAEAGCKVIFADSFGHEPYILQAAKEYPNVQFCHATGTQAHTETTVSNFANAFASIYEGRYLAGVAAGLKLQAMNKTNAPKIGYVGAWPYAEVISGYTSFFLGVRSIVPSATMEVTYTYSWFDPVAERAAATLLIGNGCDLISQHADSMGAPNACEAARVPNVSYNGSTAEACPQTFIVSSRIDWAPYYKYAITQVVKGQPVAKDWVGTLQTGSVQLTALGAAAAANTQTTLDSVKAQLESGALKVFDLSKFTVNGEHLTSYRADVDDHGQADLWAKDTEVVKTVGDVKYFAESEYRSAPYFDIIIDGITVLADAND
ncbi:MAG: BMP family ABC transporter substrate-binding protein [Clostridia bacterium]|nr:BMP family ABC transporter substrate-binding protein [Clostridia bacterium]